MKDRWFREHRIAWIKESVEIFDRINRQHIMRKFMISLPQASYDIGEVMIRWPNLMEYDRAAKCYRRIARDEP